LDLDLEDFKIVAKPTRRTVSKTIKIAIIFLPPFLEIKMRLGINEKCFETSAGAQPFLLPLLIFSF